MTDYEQLPEHLQELCGKPRTVISDKEMRFGPDLTVDERASIRTKTYHLTGVFDNGYFLGFWSHSPWGTCHDREQGWVVVSKDLKIVRKITTKSDYPFKKRSYKEWRKKVKAQFGTAHQLKHEYSDDLIWNIAEC